MDEENRKARIVGDKIIEADGSITQINDPSRSSRSNRQPRDFAGAIRDSGALDDRDDINLPLSSFDFFTPKTSTDVQRQLLSERSLREIDPAQIRQRILDQFKDRTRAIDQVFNQQLAEVRRKSADELKESLGRTRAVQSKRGLGGSPRGAAQVQGVEERSRELLNEQERAINAQRASAISALMGEADTIAREEALRREELLRNDRNAFIDFLATEDERRNENLNTVVSSLIARDIDPSELSGEELRSIASNIGVNPRNIVSLFETEKALQAEEDIESLDTFTLSPGQQRFDSEGNLIASVDPKEDPAEIGVTTLTFKDSEGNSSQRLVRYNKRTGEIIGGGVSGNVFAGTAVDSDGSTSEDSQEVSDLTKAVLDGIIEMEDLAPTDRASVASELGRTGRRISSDNAKKTLDAVTELLNFPSRQRFTGASSLFPAIKGTKRFTFERRFENLKGLLTLENLGLMSGVLSDSDIKIIKDASTVLDTGLNDADFERELNKIKEALENSLGEEINTDNATTQKDFVDKDTGTVFTLPNPNTN